MHFWGPQNPKIDQNNLAPDGLLDFLIKSVQAYALLGPKWPRTTAGFDPPRARVLFAPPLQRNAKKNKPRNLAPFSLIQCLQVSKGPFARSRFGGGGIATARPARKRRRGNGPRYTLTPLYGGGWGRFHERCCRGNPLTRVIEFIAGCSGSSRR